ncbi:hypothetical protein [Burkholderia sp. Ax-1719]|jgi:hypothetical protein|uniref:hypothetical protein n=1 Tax=Burkholderia sp. Ax-1719 TaxID=2608334 RepID=UPI001423BBEE|nr:hypothetical protein [Burkholderia sp. Ax-1719]NIE66061.1 hypothetical protein [Burkholderia sp. Ax-1719]
MRINFLTKCIATLAITAGVALAICFAKTNSLPTSKMSESAVTLQLGDPSLSKITGLKTDNHPTGMDFYEADFSQADHQTITIESGKNSFQVNNVISLMGAADKDVPGGIFEWKSTSTFSDKQVESPEVARDGMMQILARLEAAGWRRFIDNESPRLTGEQAWHYGTSAEGKGVYPLDPSYKPDLEEWRAGEDSMPSWTLYANGTYIEISLQASGMAGVAGKKTYLVNIDVKNEYAFYALGYFPGDSEKMRHWEKYIPAVLAKAHAKRLATEATLKAQGYTIDTTYEDPPIKALQDAAGKPE